MTPGDTLTVAGAGSVSTAMSGDTLTITGTDNNTTYSAGDGLDLSGTTFSTDLKSGSGLVITLNELDIDTSVIQARVLGTCSTGNSIRAIAADGAVTCQEDTDTNTNQLTTFTLTADSGSDQTIDQGSTFDIAGGTNATTVVGATDTVTINIDDAFVVNSGDDTMAGTLTAKGVTLSDGSIGPGLVKILEDTDLGSNFTSITVGDMASDAAYTLPTALPSGNRILQSTAQGVLSWVSDTDTNTQLTEEEVEDFVGGMLGGTQTGITVTYNDTDNDIDFVVADLTVAGDIGSTAMTPGDTLTVVGSGSVSTAMSGGTLTITGSGGSGGVSFSDTSINANEIVTVSSTGDLDGESNLTFDGTTLDVTGDIEVTSGGISVACNSGGGTCGVTLEENSRAPGTPSSGESFLHARDDGNIYQKRSGGSSALDTDTNSGVPLLLQSVISFEQSISGSPNSYFIPINGSNEGSTSESNESIYMPDDITILELACTSHSGFGGTNTGRKIIPRVDGVDVELASATTGCMANFYTDSDTGGVVRVGACIDVVVCSGETVSLHAYKPGSSSSSGVSCVIKYVFGDLTGHCSP